MDLLPAESSQIKKKHGFRSLKLVNIDMDDALSEKPFGVDYGRLDNGLCYYVRSNSKPRMRAALALAVKAGSVLEEEDERGVAHIVEHLAFSATKKYTNHDIVKFLESIGAEFGPCQNAVTSSDETVYELFVPVDKPELLSQAISVLAEFSSEVRVSMADLEKERGAVMEEYRGNRNANGRMQDAHWVLMMEGSKYAERLPIGLEKVIRTVSADTVKQFYRKWYHLHNMAVIAVGDFSDTQVGLFPSHEEPRFSCFVESEAAGSAVMISCKMPGDELKTVKDYRNLLAESMFFHALNQRFFKMSRRKDPSYFSCSAAADVLVRPVKAYIMTSSCKERGTIAALESMLIEVARVRLHGFSEREISVVRSLLMSEIESAYLERDQMQSTSLRDEYLQHFLRNEPVIGVEYEAQLQKTIIPVTHEVSKYAENFRTSCSCVVKTIEPHATATVHDLEAVVSKINCLEEERSIPPWDDENIPEEIVSEKPNPGHVVQQTEWSNIGATELILSNGMRVCYKRTDFFDDQVLFTGFSYGGLSELPENEYLSCSTGSTIAGEIGIFGYRPSVIMDMLAGKRAEVGTKLGAYMRTFSGDCSPSDLETALQLVYQLFTTDVEPGEEDIKIVMQMAEEAVRAQERDPYTAFANRVRELNYGNSYFFRPIRISDIKKVDPFKACEYFNNCFKDPSSFTVVIVGNIDPAIARPLVLQYLGGIPRPREPIFQFNRDDLKGLPFTFPSTIIREVVRSPMVEAQCSVQLCFPVELKNETMMEDIHVVGFLSKLLETKIIQVLRFKYGQIYSASVSVFLGGNKPSRTSDVRGDIGVNFSCDPDISNTLVDLALDEILRLQEEGPSDDDVSTILEIEQRAHENGLQENYYWLDRILRSYQSRIYTGDVGTSFEVSHKGSRRGSFQVRNSLTPLTAQLALQRILPFPCKKQYTVVILMPWASRFKRLRSFIRSVPNHYGRDATVSHMLLLSLLLLYIIILAGIAGLTVMVLSLWRYSRSTLKS
ncbi:hypothetical protein C3L33_03583, partial [Rhododendron williamsianum]